MKEFRWKVNPAAPQEFMNQFPELSPVVLQLLHDRGVKTKKEIQEFLNPDYEVHLHDPFLFRQMNDCVALIFKHIKDNTLIYIHGDYDADGVCASAILKTTIEELGGNVEVYLPHRETEGYGLSEKTVQYIHDKNAKLIITTDCGITNVNEISLAKSLGMEAIVTDHHDPPEVLPECLILHPKLPGEIYPYPALAGGGVALKLAQALLRKKAEEGDKKYLIFEKWLLDLAAIATVADMMPLLGENRTIVKYGLIVLNKVNRLGMKALLKEAGLLNEALKPKQLLNAYSIGFQIGPRINAAGRMDHANIAYELLISSSTEKAARLSKNLEKNNDDRKELVSKIIDEAANQIGEVDINERRVLSAYNKDWPLGVVGLVAGKLMNQYYLPVVILGDLNGLMTGSARSIEGFNFIEALRSEESFFEKYGGHAMAAGFSLKEEKKLDDLINKMSQKFEAAVSSEEILPVLSIDKEIFLSEVNWDLLNLLKQCEPFGKENPTPLFLSKKVTIQSIKPVGADLKHLKMSVSSSDTAPLSCIGFSLGNKCKLFSVSDKVDIVYEIDENVWNGNREIQLKIIDLKKSE